MPKPCIVDTNVVVSGLIGKGGPPTQIVNAMLRGELPYALSADLFEEYASVLRRPTLVSLHGCSDNELGALLEDIAANAIWQEPEATARAPDAGDNHVWALLADMEGGQLVTGDRLLLENPSDGASVMSPRDFVDACLPALSPDDSGSGA